MGINAVIQSVGHAVPKRIVTNQELSTFVDTNDEWIVQRTGIKERRVSCEEESTNDLAIQASREALEKSGVDPKEIGMVIVGTVSGDYLWPSVACHIQNALGLTHSGGFDIAAACAGFVYSLANATALIQSGAIKSALVVGVDCLTKQLDWSDRSTCVLFGDGAGAVVLKGEENSDRGVVKSVLMSDGSGARHLGMQFGGTKFRPGMPEAVGMTYKIHMNGPEVFRFAVGAMADACAKVLKEAGLESKDIDLFVPHQANLRIIDHAAKQLKLPSEKVFTNVQKYGNTSSGSIPLALYEADKEGRLKNGMLAMTVGFGAGLTWGANIIRW